MKRVDDSEQRLIDLSHAIGQRGRIAAPAGLRAGLRASLLAAPVAPPARRRGWSRGGLWRSLIAAAVVLSIIAGSAGSAAAASLPGDPIFELKRAVEELQVALAPDAAARLDLLVEQADRRLNDLGTVAGRAPGALGPATDAYLAAVQRLHQAVSEVQAAPAAPARMVALERAALAAARHVSVLEALAGRLPSAAQPGIQRAIEMQQQLRGTPGGAPSGAPVRPTAPTIVPSVPVRTSTPARPTDAPIPPGRGGPPSGVPGRP